MLWVSIAGVLAGLVTGFLGPGGTIIGLPFLLYLDKLSPHTALGTNALGVSIVAFALLAWRLWKREVPWRQGLLFVFPGLLGNYAGAQFGLIFPGRKLIFLLGILLFAIAGWLFYLSTRSERAARSGQTRKIVTMKRLLTTGRAKWLIPTAFVVGLVAGFFAVGGGFMIVPALAILGEMELMDAASAGLVPIAAFAGWIGLQYWYAGSVQLPAVGLMFVPGFAGGVLGVKLGQRLPKKMVQRIFALFLICLGLYMSLK